MGHRLAARRRRAVRSARLPSRLGSDDRRPAPARHRRLAGGPGVSAAFAGTPVTVTGGSGFIGSSVVDALIDAGYTVRILDTQSPYRGDVDWRPVDLLDLAGLTAALEGSGPVIHLAAMADVNDVIASPARSVEINVGGTVNVLEAARQAGA